MDCLAVYDSDLGRYIAGIECDGATYHSSKNARERDISRQRFLESRGWNILRIWSKNWWYNSKAEVNRINNELLKLRNESITSVDSSKSTKDIIKYTGMDAVLKSDIDDSTKISEDITERDLDIQHMKKVLQETIEKSQLNQLGNDIVGVTNRLNLADATRDNIKGNKIKGIIINNTKCIQLKSWHNVLTTVISETLKECSKEKLMLSLGDKNFIELTPTGMAKPVSVADNLWIETKLDAFGIIQRCKLVCKAFGKNNYILLIGSSDTKNETYSSSQPAYQYIKDSYYF